MTNLFPLIRIPISVYTIPFLNSTALSLILKHTDYTVQPQGLLVTVPVWDATKAT
jgi:hypothetical protein